MRYMVFVNMREDVGAPTPALVSAMNELMTEGFASGVLVDVGGLWSTGASTEFVVRGGQVTTTDGPFAEAKEVVGGYAVIEVRDDDEAREQGRLMATVHQQHWPEWEGSVHVRRIASPSDGPPPRD
ncbi:YciI family protein [Nocardioides sp. InS609-2]|uniref:YciI family protein n=1 Tax=Nocardioides sp. InS609-2 TaxID=2760705 RepID=UPI0020C12A41|nr:YciI family protein [Nocardioides sp. InS609-2]